MFYFNLSVYYLIKFFIPKKISVITTITKTLITKALRLIITVLKAMSRRNEFCVNLYNYHFTFLLGKYLLANIINPYCSVQIRTQDNDRKRRDDFWFSTFLFKARKLIKSLLVVLVLFPVFEVAWLINIKINVFLFYVYIFKQLQIKRFTNSGCRILII